MVEQHLLCGLLWVVFCVLHSVFASGAVKRKTITTWPGLAPFYRIAYTLFAFLSLAAVVGYQLGMVSPLLFQTSSITRVAGGAVLALGLVLMAVCIKKYFLSLSGLKSLFHKIPAGSLMVTGVHRYVRHPLYSGTFLAIWGLFLLLPLLSLLIANVVITGYTLLALRYEEAKLLNQFGDDYATYRRKVPPIFPSFRAKRG